MRSPHKANTISRNNPIVDIGWFPITTDPPTHGLDGSGTCPTILASVNPKKTCIFRPRNLSTCWQLCFDRRANRIDWLLSSDDETVWRPKSVRRVPPSEVQKQPPSGGPSTIYVLKNDAAENGRENPKTTVFHEFRRFLSKTFVRFYSWQLHFLLQRFSGSSQETHPTSR